MDVDEWQRLRARIVADDRRAQQLANWNRIRPLLDCAPAAVEPALRALVADMDESAFTGLWETFAVVVTMLTQHAQIAGITDFQEYTRRWNAFVASSPDEARVVEGLLNLQRQLGALRKPVTEQPLDAAEQALFATGTALGDRLQITARSAVPGAASAAVVDALDELIGEYRTLLAATPIENRMRRMLLDALEFALESAGRCNVLINRPDAACEDYGQAADAYAARGEIANAQRCRDAAQAVRDASTGDVDAIVRANTHALLVDAASGQAASLATAQASVALVSAAVKAGDTFGARPLIAQSVGFLGALGYRDPFVGDAPAVCAAWIDAVPADVTGTPLLARLSAVSTAYFQITGARVMLAKDDAPTALAAQQALNAIHAFSQRIFDEATAAEAQLEATWKAFSGSPLGLSSQAAAQLAALETSTRTLQERIMVLAATIGTLVDDVNAAPTSGAPLEPLRARALQAQAEAAALGQPAYVASATLVEADVLLASGRPSDALAVLDPARAAWAKAFDPAAAVAAGDAQQRALDVQFLFRMAQADAALGDTHGLFARTGEAIETIERDRYNISSPYAQSAFLKDRALLYVLGVFSAYKLGDFAAMLERIELAKARAALRLRFFPEPPAIAIGDLEAQFRAVSARIDVAATPDLLAQRRAIWDLLAIGRLRSMSGGAAVIPEFSLSALQASLEADEAVLCYYWLDVTVLLVAAIDAHGIAVERVIMPAADRADFDDFIGFIGTVIGKSDILDAGTQAFAATVLPPQIMAFISGKTRLIISPHHGLHLFPFAAIGPPGARLIQRAAVSYTPSLSMLLAPAGPPQAPRVLLAGVDDFSAVTSKVLVALPGVDVELADVAQVYRAAGTPLDLLQNSEVTRAALSARSDSGELARYTCIVLATHASSVFDADVVAAPMESRLYLHAEPLDGLELSRLRLAADLVVLSACSAGQRAIGGLGMDALPGDDLFGLQAALNMAGANAVLAALWPVTDAVTPALMAGLHQRLAAGLPVDLALQGAIVDHLQRGVLTDPFFWASFFVSIMGRRSQSGPR